ncbi:MAG: hypothetical protein A2571_03490 [Candidatus Vogelbacteria bacterium RIFOXYD1_FULL_44_32]|uniref:Uncharacterized protein n=1 Tax=Candidatus Vogelbacteria bacterium RIFOXYD1_FULL_44_32 TaxID=1802438 RepID=A0A1G2QGI7_9BACT|nr:MAG: hypothetical protein A2571_03490 [Candidatus Vogelbacteria bacterium RIFOXYD1_FULL_44_32]
MKYNQGFLTMGLVIGVIIVLGLVGAVGVGYMEYNKEYTSVKIDLADIPKKGDLTTIPKTVEKEGIATEKSVVKVETKVANPVPLKVLTKKYTHPFGIYSFSYPASWELAEENSYVSSQWKDNLKPGFVFQVSYMSLSDYFQFTTDAKPTANLLGRRTWIATTIMSETPSYVVDSGIPLSLSSGKTDTLAIVFTASSYDDTVWQVIKSTVIGSSINQTAFATSVAKDWKEAENVADSVEVISKLGSLAYAIELYFDDRNKSYKGACLTDDRRTSVPSSRESILESISPDNYKCIDSQDSYAVSVLLKSGRYYCIDSTGYKEYVSGLNTGTSCKK